MPIRNRRRRGFTLIEAACGFLVVLIGLLSLAGVMVSASHQREQAAVKRLIIANAQTLLEEIKGVSPDLIEIAYDGKRVEVMDLDGTSQEGTAIDVDVDGSNPKVLMVTVSAEWTVGSHPDSFSLSTEIYNPSD